jgi:hypothetical protein
MHANGQSVRQDFTKAAKWFKLAADQGHANAIAALGMALHQILFSPGTKVKLVGLKAAALNGKRGVVVDGEAALGRVVVLVDGDATPKAFSFENLVVVAEVAGERGGGGGAAASVPAPGEEPAAAPRVAAPHVLLQRMILRGGRRRGKGSGVGEGSSAPAVRVPAEVGAGGAVTTTAPLPPSTALADATVDAAAKEKRRKKKEKAARQKAKKKAARAADGGVGTEGAGAEE